MDNNNGQSTMDSQQWTESTCNGLKNVNKASLVLRAMPERPGRNVDL